MADNEDPCFSIKGVHDLKKVVDSVDVEARVEDLVKHEKVCVGRVLHLGDLTPCKTQAQIHPLLFFLRKGRLRKGITVTSFDRFVEVLVELKANKEVQYLKVVIDKLVHHREILLDDLCFDSRVL